MDKAKNLETLKEDYEVIRKKYNLPDFTWMNSEFGIENLQEHKSETLIRQIRYNIMKRITSAVNWFEMFVNPQRAPFFLLSVMSKLTDADKELMQKLYKKNSSIEFEMWVLDSNPYNEKTEAEFVKNTIKQYKEIAVDILKFSQRIEKLYKAKE